MLFAYDAVILILSLPWICSSTMEKVRGYPEEDSGFLPGCKTRLDAEGLWCFLAQGSGNFDNLNAGLSTIEFVET